MNIREEIREIMIFEWKKDFENKVASGLSAKEYSQHNGIGKEQYFYWKKIVIESFLDGMMKSL